MRIALASCSNLPDWEVDDHPLVQALQERDVEVLTPAWDDPEVDWAALDACLIRTTWDYTARADEYLAWVERVDQVTRIFNRPEVVRWNINKRYLHDLEQRGVAIVPTIWLEPGEADLLQARLRDSGWTRGFLKPVVGANAEQTLRFDNDAAGRDAASEHLLSCNAPMMAQPYLEAVETFGELSALFVEQTLSHAVRKIPVPGDYRVQDDWGASDEPYEFSAAQRAQVEALQRLLPPDLLYARIDLLRDGDAFYCNEVELIEPSLFLRHGPETPARLADALLKRILRNPM